MNEWETWLVPLEYLSDLIAFMFLLVIGVRRFEPENLSLARNKVTIFMFITSFLYLVWHTYLLGTNEYHFSNLVGLTNSFLYIAVFTFLKHRSSQYLVTIVPLCVIPILIYESPKLEILPAIVVVIMMGISIIFSIYNYYFKKFFDLSVWEVAKGIQPISGQQDRVSSLRQDITEKQY